MPELPLEIWKDRIQNEIQILQNLKLIEPNSIAWHENNVEIIINIKALGFILGNYKEGREMIPQLSHQIFLKINRSFPYPGGIDFAWQSNIFHPNIHPINLTSPNESGTGYICLNVLKQWSRLSDLENTTKALKMLVENPNSDDPLNYNLCLRAAEFFKGTKMEELKKQYNYKEIEEENDDDDVIIIDD